MLKVIPSVNCHYRDDECVEHKLRVLEGFAEMVHLDIADGAFTMGKSWNDVAFWKKLNPKVKFEVHLMVEHPEREAEKWFEAGAERIVFHIESLLHPYGRPRGTKPEHVIEELLTLALRHKAELMLAINPETPLAAIEPYMKKFTAFQVFAQAHMGPPGQKFLPTVLPKIKFLRDTLPHVTIEIDGGINFETATRAKDAGADTVIAGSYVLNAPDPKTAYEELRNI